MKLLLDNTQGQTALYPLTLTRTASALRVGILTIRSKWQLAAGADIAEAAEPRLEPLWPAPEGFADAVRVDGRTLPTPEVIAAVRALAPGQALDTGSLPDGSLLRWPTDVFGLNDRELRADYALLTRGRTSEPLPPHCTLIGDPASLFIEPGARVLCSTFNVTDGPIYIGRDAMVMEGCSLRGPVALCRGAVLKMGAKVYGATTIGPWCKVGGEVGNVVFQGYSNKAHDGYLGNSVIGEWCNLGADTVSSNLKNDYSLTRLWDYDTGRFRNTGLQFCGLIMGDHSKTGINTMLNTATSVGVGCNIHGAGFPRTFIPSYSFGGAAGFTRVIWDKFADTARRVMARRGVELTPAMEQVLRDIYDSGV